MQCGPEENFESFLAASKSFWTSEMWYKALEEEHVAQVKCKSLFGHLLCLEVLPEKFLESDIFSYSRNRGSQRNRHFISNSFLKIYFDFWIKNGEGEIANYREIHSCFWRKEVLLSFQKWQSGPLKNGKEPIFVKLFLPDCVSDLAVRLPFSNLSVFHSRHKFNRSIRNRKR